MLNCFCGILKELRINKFSLVFRWTRTWKYVLRQYPSFVYCSNTTFTQVPQEVMWDHIGSMTRNTFKIGLQQVDILLSTRVMQLHHLKIRNGNATWNYVQQISSVDCSSLCLRKHFGFVLFFWRIKIALKAQRKNGLTTFLEIHCDFHQQPKTDLLSSHSTTVHCKWFVTQ